MKLRGPMFSLGASGSVGGVVTFANWKGRPYARELVTPSNPKSPSQTANRVMMRFLSQAWAAISDGDKATWQDLAASGAFSPFNAFVRNNMFRWTQYSGPTQAYPAAETSYTQLITSLAATGGVRQATVTGAIIGATAWGAIIFRNDTTGFTPTKSDVVGIVNVDGLATFTFVDSPVTPGTWYYLAVVFNFDGTIDFTLPTEASATVTG